MKITIEIDLDEYESLDYVGKAEWLMAKVRIAKHKALEEMVK